MGTEREFVPTVKKGKFQYFDYIIMNHANITGWMTSYKGKGDQQQSVRLWLGRETNGSSGA